MHRAGEKRKAIISTSINGATTTTTENTTITTTGDTGMNGVITIRATVPVVTYDPYM